MATSTGNALGTVLHQAATDGINMNEETQAESLRYWKKIANALIDFLADTNSNPITIKCGSNSIVINGSGITENAAVITHKSGDSQLVIDDSGITENAAAKISSIGQTNTAPA
ncbi:MAG: hypothetical protein LBN21_04245 [Treponema sp.]|jgi:hypothetical protein|nr:hypothetical protein [Treponema sp.]